jgi:hypothetical protein
MSNSAHEATVSNQILVYDPSVDQVEVLLDGLSPEVRAIPVMAGQDPALVIDEALANPALRCLHVLGHGAPGEVILAGQRLDAQTFLSPRNASARGASSATPFQIAFWSCKTGLGEIGMNFVNTISNITGAHVFASSGLVGHEDKGGSWALDVSAAPMAPFSGVAREGFRQVLPTFTRLNSAGSTFTEGGASTVAVYSSTSGATPVITLDSGTDLINAYSFVVTNVSAGNTEQLVFDGTSINLGASAGTSSSRITPNQDGVAYSWTYYVEYSGTTATVYIVNINEFEAGSGTGITASMAASLLRTVRYYNTDENPTATGATRAITASITDLGLAGVTTTATAAPVTVTVAGVNDAPVNVYSTRTGNEDAQIAISGLSVSDVDNSSVTVTLTQTNGTLSLTDATGIATGSGTATVTLNGTVTAINTALASLTYTPTSNFAGSSTLTVATSDGTATDTDVITINVSAINDAPALVTSGVIATVDEDSVSGSAASLWSTAPSYGVGGGSDESTQSLSYTITAVPSFINLYKADGTTAVTAGTSLTAAEFAALKYKTVENGNGTGSVTFDVIDSGSGSGSNVNTLSSQSVSMTVTAVNEAPTGSVTISGTVAQGETLTASNSLVDVDGLGSISYQWQADNVNISGATSGTLVLGEAQVGKAIKVVASYNDLGGTSESVSSAATASVANVNDAPTGSVTITGTATQGETLTASNSLADVDGLNTPSYQWKADGVDISGATGSTLVLAQDQVGKVITVVASYTDVRGTSESVSSSATGAVVNINDAPVATYTTAQSVNEASTISGTLTSTDADNNSTATYAVVGSPIAA